MADAFCIERLYAIFLYSLDCFLTVRNVLPFVALHELSMVHTMTHTHATRYVCGFELNPRLRGLTMAAAGTVGWVPWENAPDAASVLAKGRERGYLIAAVEQSAGSISPEAMKSSAEYKGVYLVVGAERQGVSAEALALCDHCVELPSDGVGCSMNLATATAIVLHSAANKFPLRSH
jgi:tRNA(Leu) C34 or U34 (ribose-2'-O)-methylase TrmL